MSEEKISIKDKVRAGYGMARMLKEYGVEHVFGIPDGHTLAFYDGLLRNEGIDHILMNDERSAAFAADAYARVTGSLGVCDAGAAGAMNFPTALSEADGFGSPVLAIVGIIKAREQLRNIPHDINVTDTLKPITKWTGEVLNVEYLPRFMKFAIKSAINGRPGTVGLVIAEDAMASKELRLKEYIPKSNGGSCSVNYCRPAPAENEITVAVKMIQHSQQPVLFTGGEAVLSGAYAEVAELSKILNAPVFSTISGKGIMRQEENQENLYFGTVGLFGEKPNNKFIRRKADLVIVVGNRLTEDDTANFKYPKERTEMIQIDLDPAQIGLSYHPWGVVGDPKVSLDKMIRMLDSEGILKLEKKQDILEKRAENIRYLKKKHTKYREEDTEKWIDAEPIKPQRVLKAISDNLTGEDYLVTDASTSSRWIGPYFPVKSLGRHIITPRGVGPTGFGVGALIGTCIAVKNLPKTPNTPNIVLFTGDGGLMNGGINEFETINKLDLTCTIVVINNSQLGFVKFGQAILYRRRFYDTDRPQTDFAKIAETFKGHGERIEKLDGLDTAIANAISNDGFNLVDVVIDPKEYLPPNFY
ncbi:MAG: thiamine pyrophosphate-binding protein [Promethearchaeia archaeon]